MNASSLSLNTILLLFLEAVMRSYHHSNQLFIPNGLNCTTTTNKINSTHALRTVPTIRSNRAQNILAIISTTATKRKPATIAATKKIFTKMTKTASGNRSWRSIPIRINAANVAVRGMAMAIRVVRAVKVRFCTRNRVIRPCKYSRWNWYKIWTVMSEFQWGLWKQKNEQYSSIFGYTFRHYKYVTKFFFKRNKTLEIREVIFTETTSFCDRFLLSIVFIDPFFHWKRKKGHDRRAFSIRIQVWGNYVYSPDQHFRKFIERLMWCPSLAAMGRR